MIHDVSPYRVSVVENKKKKNVGRYELLLFLKLNWYLCTFLKVHHFAYIPIALSHECIHSEVSSTKPKTEKLLPPVGNIFT